MIYAHAARSTRNVTDGEAINKNMAAPGNSAHLYKFDDGKFRLTFISTSKGGARFLSEIGEFTRWEIKDWLKDHLHPATDFAALLEPIARMKTCVSG
jgi:hypothetical protein